MSKLSRFTETSGIGSIVNKPKQVLSNNVLPRGSHIVEAKEGDYLAVKFRRGNAYTPAKELICVDGNHVALGIVGPDGRARFMGNITTNKETSFPGRSNFRNIPFSHIDCNGNQTFHGSNLNETLRVRYHDPERDQKLLDYEMSGYKKLITQFIYPWSHVIIPTSLDVYQKETVEQRQVLRDLMILYQDKLKEIFPSDVLLKKPYAFYNKGSASDDPKKYDGFSDEN